MAPLHSPLPVAAVPPRAATNTTYHGFEARVDGVPVPSQEEGSRPRILIVEDGLIVAEDMRRRCESLGYSIAAVVASGEEAVDIAQMTRPDLVLMDIRLGGIIDGIEAARRIRQTLDVPVVYTTSYSDEATLRRAKTTNPLGYLLKPVEPQELRTTVELALYRHTTDCTLRSTEEHFSALLESSFDAVLIMDREGLISACNQQSATLLGAGGPDEVVGEKIARFLSLAETHKFSLMLRKTVDARALQGLEITFQPLEGRPFQSVVNLRTANGHGGSKAAILAVIRNPFAQPENRVRTRFSRRHEARVRAGG
jgi:PAS domain S-box-containing protein